MSKLIKGQVVALFALLTALVVTLAACGGGSSSTGGGGGSGTTIAGTVNDGAAGVHPAGTARPLLVAVADVLVEPAHAAPMPGVAVTLTGPGGNQTTTTDANGRFEFTVQESGIYTVEVLGEQIQVGVGSDSSSEEVQVTGSGAVVSIEVRVQGNTVSGTVEDDASSDGVSNDDLSSDDDDSSGDGASDDDSVDDGNSDDESDDETSVD